MVLARAAPWGRVAQHGTVRRLTNATPHSSSHCSFYGQGLNCGLEDVRVLNSYLERHNISAKTTAEIGESDDKLAAALHAYSTGRHQDLKAICELALQN